MIQSVIQSEKSNIPRHELELLGLPADEMSQLQITFEESHYGINLLCHRDRDLEALKIHRKMGKMFCAN